MALKLGLQPEFIPTDWRGGVDASLIERKLREDKDRKIKAVCVVHNETSTGVTSRIAEVRDAIDAAGHPALLLVDTISGLACADYRHDEWDVDVTVSFAEGLDAAARHFLQRRQRKGARRIEGGETAAPVLVVGRDDPA